MGRIKDYYWDQLMEESYDFCFDPEPEDYAEINALRINAKGSKTPYKALKQQGSTQPTYKHQFPF